MGTRYETGDLVVYGRQKYQVMEVQQPESDSPDYLLGKTEGKYTDPSLTVKASDIKKADENVDIEILKEKKQGKTDAVFYCHKDEIAYAEKNSKEYLLQVSGEVRAEIDDKIYREGDTQALIEDYNITDDDKLADLEDSGKLVFQNNCWFEVFVRENETGWHGADVIAHDYDTAIKRMKEHISG